MKKLKNILKISSLSIVIFSYAYNLNAQDKIESVTIGKQIWMVENLNVNCFRNGDIIPEAKTAAEWQTAAHKGLPAWCYYDDNIENAKKYGRLYNWYAVSDKRGLAPEGWHVSSEAEFEILAAAVNKNSNSLKAIKQGDNGGEGTNTSGFRAFVVGSRKFDGEFIGGMSAFWSSTEYNDLGAECQLLPADNSEIWFNVSDKGYGYSVRCIKN